MQEQPTIDERCDGCGKPLDDDTAFRISRAGRSYCCLCYLAHDADGKPFHMQRVRERGFAFNARPDKR